MDNPEWAIPVKSSVTGKPAFLKITVNDAGEVVVIPPPGAGFVLPETSDILLLQAHNHARELAARGAR